MKKLIFPLTVLILTGITSCSRKIETYTVKTSSGNELSSENKLPEGFSSDFPIYKDVNITGSTKLGKTIIINFEINDKADNVGNIYKTEMSKAGYEAEKDDKMMTSDREIITFQKNSKLFDLTYNNKEYTGKTYLTMPER